VHQRTRVRFCFQVFNRKSIYKNNED